LPLFPDSIYYLIENEKYHEALEAYKAFNTNFEEDYETFEIAMHNDKESSNKTTNSYLVESGLVEQDVERAENSENAVITTSSPFKYNTFLNDGVTSDVSASPHGSAKNSLTKSPRFGKKLCLSDNKENLLKLYAKRNGNKNFNKTFDYILVMILVLISAYLFQGIRYIMPKTIAHQTSRNEDTSSQSTANFIEIAASISGVSCLLTGFLLETSFFQRLRLLKITSCLASFCTFGAFYFSNIMAYFVISSKAFLTIQDHVLEIYSAEIFDTKRRVLFLSVCNILTSISNFISPFVNDLLHNYWFRANYLVFGIISTITFTTAMMLTKEKFKSSID
jgi:hypothetical protein